jgi:hypothetical protein
MPATMPVSTRIVTGRVANMSNSAAWMIKSSFMGGYVMSMLTSLNSRNDDILHTGSYYDINIQNIEFGKVSKWKRKNKKGGKGGTVS